MVISDFYFLTISNTFIVNNDKFDMYWEAFFPLTFCLKDYSLFLFSPIINISFAISNYSNLLFLKSVFKAKGKIAYSIY